MTRSNINDERKPGQSPGIVCVPYFTSSQDFLTLAGDYKALRMDMVFFVTMLIEFFGTVWKRLPGRLRLRLMRVGQKRFTVTAGVMIFDKEGRILLLDHVFRPDSGWGIPGGFLTKGEQPEAAVRRELKEEVGIELDSVELLFARTLPRARQIEICFRARAIGQPEPRSFEIRSAGWFSIDNLPAELSKDQQALIRRALAASENSNQ